MPEEAKKYQTMDDLGQSVVEIDEHRLDRECIRLASNYLRWANKVAHIRADLDQCKAEQDVMEADLQRSIRDNPGKFGLEKVTDKAVDACVSSNPKYTEKQEEYRKLKHHLELAQAVVSALDIKKRTLTLLVDLYGMSYFSEPKLSAEGKEAVKSINARRLARRASED